MALASSGRHSANGGPSVAVVVVDYECCSVGKWEWFPDPTPLWNEFGVWE